MDLSIKPLRCLVAVAELRSFTRAAERLNMTQPSLSIKIGQLERHLGFRLFERSTRQVELTAAGEFLLEYAVRLIRENDRLLNAALELRGNLSNRLRLGAALYTFEIAERQRLIEGFVDSHPNIELEVDAHTQSEILSNLTGHNLDAALIIGLGLSDEDFEHGGRAELTFPLSLRRLTIRRERIGLRVPVDSALAAHSIIPDSALAGQTVAVPSNEHGVRLMQPILDHLREHGATTIQPPEATGTAIERYGSRFRLPALTFGWFEQPDNCGTVRRNLESLNMATELAILTREAGNEGATAKFLSFAKRLTAPVDAA